MKISKLHSYHRRALAIAVDSPDEQTQVAALLIHKKTGAVLGSGFNGFIRGGPDYCLPKTRPKKYEYIVHAEANLIANCARHGVSTDECFLYCTLSPCVGCARLLYQAGISKVYFKEMYRDFEKNSNMKDLVFSVKPLSSTMMPADHPGVTPEFYELTIAPRT